VLKCFCLTYGLVINGTKSTFHQYGMTEHDLLPFKAIFPYSFLELDLGFKYLGFLLKTRAHHIEDWGWLLKKMEKRINNWCYRWLSLGGCFTLLKAMLVSQPIYWMSLTVVPCSVLNT